MTLQDRFITVEDFEAFIKRPENADKRFEYIGGEIVEKMVSNDIASAIAAKIIGLLYVYLSHNDIGQLLTADGGFMVQGERYIPDVSFITYQKHPELLGVAYRPQPPDLAVEVVSSERKSENETLTVKVQNYLTAGTVVWVVRPEKRQIEVFEPGKPALILRKGDTLKGGTLLPNLELKIDTIFKNLPA